MYFQQTKLQGNSLLGGYFSQIYRQTSKKSSEKLSLSISKKLYKKTVDFLYEREKSLALKLHQQQQLKNINQISHDLSKYGNSQQYMIQKIFTAGKSVKIGRKPIIRKIKIQQKYNTLLSHSLHAMVEAESIQKHKNRIKQYMKSFHTSPMVQKFSRNLRSTHCNSNTNKPYNPTASIASKNSYKIKRRPSNYAYFS